MARMRVFVVLVMAIAAGGVFAYGTYNYVQGIQPTSTQAIDTKPVVVAAVDLEVGAEISREDVRVVQWPAASVPDQTLADPNLVVGRGLVMPMVQNEPFLELKLASKESGAGLPPVIPTGLRAVSVKVNEVVGVAGYVLPGTRVDVVATVNPTQRPTDMTSKVILTNVQVVAAGTKIEQATDKDKPIPVTVVTLLVDPAEAERLTLASTEGKIQLALRNPLDTTTPATRGIKPAALLADAATTPRAIVRNPRPATTPTVTAQGYPMVEIIRGDQRAQEPVRQE
jgi:pilus assembly protein CpaB